MSITTDEQLKELTDKLEEGVLNLYSSGRYAEYLAAMSKFHQYSFRNALLILLQCPSASLVAGYNTWKKDFGRHVKRHEQGIQIIAPCPIYRTVTQEKKDSTTGQIMYNSDGTPQTEECTISIPRFRIVTVFDVSQTEGQPLPSLGVSELTGDVERYDEIYDRLVASAPLPVVQDVVPGTAKGYTSFIEQRIVLRPGMSQVQTLKTLIHEIAHAKLHSPDQIEGQKQRREKEVEAESIAYVVCQSLGLDTSEYSFRYPLLTARRFQTNFR